MASRWPGRRTAPLPAAARGWASSCRVRPASIATTDSRAFRRPTRRRLTHGWPRHRDGGSGRPVGVDQALGDAVGVFAVDADTKAAGHPALARIVALEQARQRLGLIHEVG